jgi:hypothetical protein
MFDRFIKIAKLQPWKGGLLSAAQLSYLFFFYTLPPFFKKTARPFSKNALPLSPLTHPPPSFLNFSRL